MEYKALRDFKFRNTPRGGVQVVKKGEKVEIRNNPGFPDIEDKMVHLKYVTPIKKDKE